MRLAEHDGELLHWFYDEGYVPGDEDRAQRARSRPRGQFTVKVDGHERAIAEKAAAGSFVAPVGVSVSPRSGSVEASLGEP